MALVNFQNQTIDLEGRSIPARVTVFYRGTSDRASGDIFQRANGGTITNPFNADDGYVSFWASPGAYDVRMEDQAIPPRFATRTVGFDAVSGDVGGILLKQAGEDLMRQAVPIGGVIDWWRPTPPAGVGIMPVPAGFEICDGRSIPAGSHDFGFDANLTLPDLRNKFIIGADTPDTPLNYREGQPQITGSYRGDGVAGPVGEGSSNSPGIRGQAGSNAVKNLQHSHIVDNHTHNLRWHYHVTDNHDHGLYMDAPGMTNAGNHGHLISGQGYAQREAGRTDGNLQSFYVYNHSNVGLSIDGPGDHSHTVFGHMHGATAQAPNTSGPLWEEGIAATHASAPSTNQQLTNEDLRPSYYGLLKIMKVRRA